MSPSLAPGRRWLGLAAPAFAALSLCGCIGGGEAPPSVTARRHISHPVAVDPAQAAALISGFRRENGLGPVKVSGKLDAIAATQAKGMAAADDMSHTVAGEFESRMEKGGYDAEVAAENIGAGYESLAEAFEGWKQSSGHRANMLRDISEIGIATGYNPDGRLNVFWSLEMAKPRPPVLRNGPVAGLVMVQ